MKKYARGEIYYVRYADDFLIMFQYEEEAIKVLELLRTRLGKFGLEVAEDKTRILPIGRFKGTKEDFDFLGFTFFNTKTRGGKYRLGIRTSKKKLKKMCIRDSFYTVPIFWITFPICEIFGVIIRVP